MLAKLLDKLFPPKKLILSLRDPKQKPLVLTMDRHKQISIDDTPDTYYSFQDITLHESPKENQKCLSNGAIMGAGLAAAADKDILTGAIIGDWWEKQNDQKAHKVSIFLTEQSSKEKRVITLSLKRKEFETVKKFFKL